MVEGSTQKLDLSQNMSSDFFFGALLPARVEGKVGTLWESDSTLCDIGSKNKVNYLQYMTHKNSRIFEGTYYLYLCTNLEKEGCLVLNSWR